MPTLKAIHICNSLQPTLRQKLQKSMSCQRSIRTNIETSENQAEREKHYAQQRV
jgi:hypothetical protein